MLGTVCFGSFELRSDERVLLSGGEPVRLGGRAFDILLALVERRDRVVEFDELLDVVWPGLAVEENNLSVQVSALRKLLGEASITTVRGRGYRFTVPVTPATRQSPAAPAAPAFGLNPVPAARPRGAVVACRLRLLRASAGTADAPAALLSLLQSMADSSPPVVRQSGHELALAFAQARAAVAWALKAQRWLAAHATAVHGGLGIVLADGPQAAPGALQADADRAFALVPFAGPSEILVATDLLTELVMGVDADFEDLGEIGARDGALRAYRLAPATGSSPESVPTDPQLHGYHPSIAVLPFECILGGETDDLLGEALADEVIAGLSRIPDVSVVSGLSSRRLRRCGLSMAGQAERLSAHYLLTGTYRHTGGTLVLQVQFQDVRGGTLLRSLQLQTSLQQAFDPATSVGEHIAHDVGQAVFRHAVDRSRYTPLPDLENYALLLGAIGLLHQTAAREFERAHAMLEFLVRRPGCAGIAAAWLAKWHVLRVAQGWSPDPNADARTALDLVQRALDDGSRDALALAIGGLVHAYLFKDLDAAGRMYEEAIDVNPSEPLAWLFSATRLAYLGRGAEAEQAGEQALRLSPIDPLKSFLESLAATALLANAKWDRSVQLSRQSLRGNRMHASTWRNMVFGLVQLDRMDDARQAVRQLQLIEPTLTVSRFRERFPGRDGPMAEPWAQALQLAGLPA